MSEKTKFEELTNDPIEKLVLKLALPTMVAMIITSVYNMADTFFVSQISTSASGAVGIVSSLMSIIQAIGFTVAVGCSITLSKELGRKNNDYAQEILSTGFFTLMAIGGFIALVGILFLEPLMLLLGATNTILPFATDYAFFIFLSAPFMMASYVLNMCLRAQGNAYASMLGLASGAIVNIILDPIFIFGFDLGVAGAGYATAISQFLSFLVLFYQTNFKKDSIKITFSKVKPTLKIYAVIFKTGMPNFFRQGLASFSTVLLNVMANPYGDATIASISIVNRIVMFVISLLHGFGQGFQPVAGYNFSANKYDRVLKSFWFTMKTGILVSCVFMFIGLFFSNELISIFRDDLEVLEIGSFMLKLYSITFPFMCMSNVATMLAQSIGYSYRAMLLALSRQGIFFLPLICILPHKLGVLGLQISQPIAEIFALFFSMYILKNVLLDIKKLDQSLGVKNYDN